MNLPKGSDAHCGRQAIVRRQVRDDTEHHFRQAIWATTQACEPIGCTLPLFDGTWSQSTILVRFKSHSKGTLPAAIPKHIAQMQPHRSASYMVPACPERGDFNHPRGTVRMGKQAQRMGPTSEAARMPPKKHLRFQYSNERVIGQGTDYR